MPILALAACNILLGLWIAPHYGDSTDEAENVRYGDLSARSYRHPDRPYRDPSREDKGPFYLMVWVRSAEFLEQAVPTWVNSDARHFVNFVTFQVAVLSVYFLCLRFVPIPIAFFGALLFQTQPLLFGHAFINQKDPPFMALFALSIVVGLGAIDAFLRFLRVRGAGPDPGGSFAIYLRETLREGWQTDRARSKRIAAAAMTAAVVIPCARLLLDQPLRSNLTKLLEDASRGVAWEPINRLFSQMAENAAATPVVAYVNRALLLINTVSAVASLIMAGFAIWLIGRYWPGARARIFPRIASEIRQGLGTRILLTSVPAGVILGMALAVRSTALFAGILVAAYAFFRLGPRGTILLVAYFGFAALSAYALWPQLWGSPFGLFQASLERTLLYPQVHRTLFAGVTYLSTNLPRGYLPWLLLIQFTLPAVGLLLLGLGLTLRRAVRRDPKSLSLWVLLLWFLAPLLAVVIFQVPIYNNFRHVLFMTPPLFVMAALAFEWVQRWVRPRILLPLVMGLALLPGVAAIVRLHPYEYIFYNEIVGGVPGAYGRYGLDFWCTSYREVMRTVNQVSASGAHVAVWGPESTALPFAREDLRVEDTSVIPMDPEFQPSLVIGCNWVTLDPSFYPDAPVISTVERDGVPLAFIKNIESP